MPVRSFNIQDLLDYDPKDDDRSVAGKTNHEREKESNKKQTDITVIDVENHQEPQVLHKDENGTSVERKNKKDRTHNSEG